MMAKQTVAICEAGYYETPGGQRADITRELAAAKAADDVALIIERFRNSLPGIRPWTTIPC